MMDQLQQVKKQMAETTEQLTKVSSLLEASNQQLAIVSTRYDDSREKLSLVRQEKSEIAAAMSSITKLLTQEQQGKLKEVFCAPNTNGTAIRFVFEDKTKPTIDQTKEHKYWTQVVPKQNEYNEKRNTVSDASIAVTKQLMSYAMSPRRAVAATILYRYLLKFNSLITSTHDDLYKQDAKVSTQKGLDINQIISAAILFLFVEVDKDWLGALKQMKTLDQLAKKCNLTKLQAKIAKIDGRDEKFDPYQFDDEIKIQDSNKKPLEYAGKYALIMWKRDPLFQEKPFAEDFKKYCDRLYHRSDPSKEPSYFLDKNDQELLSKLYTGQKI